MDEQRRFKRFPFVSEAVFIVDYHSAYVGQVRDLCLKGALLVTHEPALLSVNTCGELRFTLANGIELFCMGHLAYLQQQRMGIEFDSLDLESATHLRRLVELNMGEDQNWNRELSALIDSQEIL